jgi:hypothetical protein
MNTIGTDIIASAREAVREATAMGDHKRLADAQMRLTIAECDWSFVYAGLAAGINMGARHG